VKEVWQGRVASAAVKYGEHAQMATVCCNACRTCVQTNVLGLAIAAAGGGAAWFGRLGSRLLRRG
jgi:hypothetical protein